MSNTKKIWLWPKSKLSPERTGLLAAIQSADPQTRESVIGKFLAEGGQERLLKAGFVRDNRQSNLRNVIRKLRAKEIGHLGTTYSWEDHGVPLRHEDGHRAYLCEPYGVATECLKEIIHVCEALNLKVQFWQKFGSWYPHATTAFLLEEKK